MGWYGWLALGAWVILIFVGLTIIYRPGSEWEHTGDAKEDTPYSMLIIAVVVAASILALMWPAPLIAFLAWRFAKWFWSFRGETELDFAHLGGIAERAQHAVEQRLGYFDNLPGTIGPTENPSAAPQTRTKQRHRIRESW